MSSYIIREYPGVATFFSSKEYLDIYKEINILRATEDPITAPFQSKYKAREIMLDIKEKFIERVRTGAEEVPQETEELILALFNYHLGLNYIETDEESPGEKNLNASVSVLRQYELQPQFVAHLINALNQLGILWFSWDDFTNKTITPKSEKYFEEAYKLYEKYNYLNRNTIPTIDILNPFEEDDDEKKRMETFESYHTLTIYYLSQVYSAKNMNDKSAKYSAMTLDRELRHSSIDHYNWCLNCIKLGQYHSSILEFKNAYRCLSCAEYMSKIIDANSTIPEDVEEDPIKKLEAELNWSWGKFYLAALEESVKRYESGNVKFNLNEPSPIGPQLFSALTFESNRTPVRSNLATNFNEAKELFIEGVQSLENSLNFYIFDGYVSDHVNINLEISKFYKLLSVFQLNNKECSIIHQARISSLLPLESQLSFEHYSHLVQLLIAEIANAYEELANCEIKSLEEEEITDLKGKYETARNSNEYNYKAIEFLEEYIISFADPTLKRLPDPIPKAIVKTILNTWWKMGDLWSRIIVIPDVEKEEKENEVSSDESMKSEYLDNIQKSKKLYEAIVSYCKKNYVHKYDDELKTVKQLLENIDKEIEKTTNLTKSDHWCLTSLPIV
ncbi:hypothetical protein BCR36DRAFT_586075 [Piromyces finnis]|uniref:KIF-binding protein n=1 Tax=Piromyces finnis TaxID=1754191 RepID=A0A1Y1V0T8_9FUNG|nr:hypothetical protein BCR36DRAFT_586075 [Piromyces finnis]|eukprot:ORX44715.1 hypothetical protein BCR36DRAFT_586075 [Piromyces finnis]